MLLSKLFVFSVKELAPGTLKLCMSRADAKDAGMNCYVSGVVKSEHDVLQWFAVEVARALASQFDGGEA